MTACKQSATAKFVINNQTADIMDSIMIVPNCDVKHLYSSLLLDEIGTYYADLSGTHGDGTFKFSFVKWSNRRHYSYAIGHFSNGKPSEKELFIEVWSDTIFVKNQLGDF